MTNGFRFAILAYPGAMQSAVLGLQDILAFASETSTEKLQISALTDFEVARPAMARIGRPVVLDNATASSGVSVWPAEKFEHSRLRRIAIK